MHQDLLVKRFRCLAMPGCRTESALKIAIESFDIPTQMIKTGQFRRGKYNVVEQRGYQAPATETISMDVNHPDCQWSFFIGIPDFT